MSIINYPFTSDLLGTQLEVNHSLNETMNNINVSKLFEDIFELMQNDRFINIANTFGISDKELQEIRETKLTRDENGDLIYSGRIKSNNTDEVKQLRKEIEQSLKDIKDDDVFTEFTSELSKNDKETFDTLLNLSYITDKDKLESAKSAIATGVASATERLIEKIEDEIDDKYDRMNYLKETYLKY